jgi:uncharacterized protein
MASSKSASGGGKCPICSRPTELKYRPFCSRRCADADLSRWLRGTYAIPDQVESEDGEGPEPADDGKADRGKR